MEQQKQNPEFEQAQQNPEFATHKLNIIGMERAKLIRDNFDRLLNSLSHLCIGGREFSICKTKLEEACFFAKKAMAVHLSNQENVQ